MGNAWHHPLPLQPRARPSSSKAVLGPGEQHAHARRWVRDGTCIGGVWRHGEVSSTWRHRKVGPRKVGGGGQHTQDIHMARSPRVNPPTHTHTHTSPNTIPCHDVAARSRAPLAPSSAPRTRTVRSGSARAMRTWSRSACAMARVQWRAPAPVAPSRLRASGRTPNTF